MSMKELLLFIQKQGWDSKLIFEKLNNILHNKEIIENTDLVLLLYYIALNQDKKILALLYNEYPDFDINLENNENQTAMELVLKEKDQKKKARALAFLFKYELDRNLDIQISPDNTKWIHFVVNAQKQILLPDEAGNTLLHYLILSEDKEAFEKFEAYFYGYTPRRFGEEVNKQNQTAAEIAYTLGMGDIAKNLCAREFEDSPFRLYLKNIIQKKKELLSNTDKVMAYKNAMRTEFTRLSTVIRFMPSLLDETIKKLLLELQIDFKDDFEGVEITLTPTLLQKVSRDKAEQLYYLTPIGKLEASLKEKFREHLVAYVKSKDGLLKGMEQGFNEHQKLRLKDYEKAQEEYTERYDEERNDGYASEEPPFPPSDSEFDPENAQREIDFVYDEAMLTNLNSLFHELFPQYHFANGAIGSRLYNCFVNSNFLMDLYLDLDFNRYHLDATQGCRTIFEIDFDFPDVDVTKPKFLVKILQNNLESKFDQNFYNAESSIIAERIIDKLVENPRYSALIRKFNLANNDGEKQILWMELEKPVSIIFNLLKTVEQDKKIILERKLRAESVLPQDLKEREFLKTFPTDDSSTLIYAEAQIPLKPIFKTLFSVAKETHALLEKARQPKKPKRNNGDPKLLKDNSKSKNQNKDNKEKNEATNVVSAILTFAISFESDCDYGKKRKHHFISIPLQFDYPSLLVSRDEEDQVFKNEQEYHHSIAEDTEEGGRIVGKIPQIDVATKTAVTKMELKKILSMFNFSESQAIQINETIDKAEVAQPLALEYHSKKDNVDKTTKFYHSERVILHALKDPANVKKILNYIFEACQKRFPRFEVFNKIKLNAASLIFYSYPNSVCPNCSTSFLALQNSYKKGFIKLLIDAIRQPGSHFVMAWSKNRDLQPLPKFLFTVVGSSKSIFNSDYSGQQIEKNPAAKLDLVADGICIRRKKRDFEPRKYFYEFVKSLVHEAPVQVPYDGMVAMSGSKLSKIKNAQSREAISAELKTRLEEINRVAAQRPTQGPKGQELIAMDAKPDQKQNSVLGLQEGQVDGKAEKERAATETPVTKPAADSRKRKRGER